MTKNELNPEEYRRRWGTPDWRDAKAYNYTFTDAQWRWEFLRRRDDYRADWNKHRPTPASPMAGKSIKVKIEGKLVSINLASSGAPPHICKKYGIVEMSDPSVSGVDGIFGDPYAGIRLIRGTKSKLGLDKTHVALIFDLEVDVNFQLIIAAAILANAQKTKLKRRRHRRQNWAIDLRVYDARKSELISYLKIGKELRPDLMYNEAGARMEECYKAAIRLMKDFPQQ
jgi:hypothetical protein